jgi:serine/threonine protein kinase
LHREIDIMKKLKHPHIVQLLDLFETKDNLYLVLELVEGGELFDRIVERGHYSERDAADIVKQMLQGTQYMHDNGVAHRDLKPENVLCGGPEGTIVKIADFGLSKDFGGAALQTALGTPGYVAPEVLSGNPYDSAVDLWSIGVITYVLLCGFTPFYAENQRELFEQILSADFSFPSPEWDEISDSAKDFINHLLVVSPNERLTADTALEHPWIVNEAPSRELPQLKSFRNLMADTQKKAKKNR